MRHGCAAYALAPSPRAHPTRRRAVTAFSVHLLTFLWACAAGGITLNLCYTGPFKATMQVTSYIAMGWAALLCFGDMWERLLPHPTALWLLVGGGVSYTVGVIWFVKDARSCGVPDHTIWCAAAHARARALRMCALDAALTRAPPLPSRPAGISGCSRAP